MRIEKSVFNESCVFVFVPEYECGDVQTERLLAWFLVMCDRRYYSTRQHDTKVFTAAGGGVTTTICVQETHRDEAIRLFCGLRQRLVDGESWSDIVNLGSLQRETVNVR